MRLKIDIYKDGVAINIENSKMEVEPMNKALDIAYYLIALAGERGISNLRLQKMLYFIQKEEIKNGRVAFGDKMEAWKFGPVIPSVYYEFAGRGSLPITIGEVKNEKIPFEDNLKRTIIEEFNKRRNQEVWQMVNETHVQDGAWHRIFDGGLGFGDVISIQDIKDDIINGK